MKVLGVDPGLAATGVGLAYGKSGFRVEGYAFGEVATSQRLPLPERLNRIFDETSALIEREHPDLMVVEDVFSLTRHPKSGLVLGKVIGVLLLAGCRANLQIREIPVREAKKILTGNGNAPKSQLEIAVRRAVKHPEPITPAHASDALALALIGLFRWADRKIFSDGLPV